MADEKEWPTESERRDTLRRMDDYYNEEAKRRTNMLWQWLVVEMRVNALGEDERKAYVPMVKTYLRGVEHGQATSQRWRIVVAVGLFAGPFVSVVITHLWK